MAVPAAGDICEECGFDYGQPLDDPGAALRTVASRFRAPLTRFLPGEDGDALIRARPQPDVWSALEYACHVRDVFEIQRERIGRALVEDGYEPPVMRRDERVEELAYNAQDPLVVLDAITANADALAADVQALTPEQWQRTMRYRYPAPATRDLVWVVRHTVHEGRHHLLDIGRSLRAARGR
jgi:hypothetical protein